MKSLWSESDERQAIAQWGAALGEGFARRLYTAHLIGRDPALVLHGGGNVSFKSTAKNVLGETIDVVYVKASGSDLATIEAAELPALQLEPLRRLRALDDPDHLDDEAMVNEFRRNLLDAGSATPSIETLLHAFLPHCTIDHSHADAVLALTNHKDGESLIREALGDRVAIIPYVKPGFALAKIVADAVERNPDCEGVVLLRHGLITFAADARTSYERHIELVDACERFIESRVKRTPLTVSARGDRDPAATAVAIAPILRGLLAPDSDTDRGRLGPILEWRGGDEVLAILNSTEAASFATASAMTGDHLIRTRVRPATIEKPALEDSDQLREQLRRCVCDYRRDYSAYVGEHGGGVEGRDYSPRVVLIPGVGVFAWGNTKRDARIAADISEHTLNVQSLAHRMGGYVALPQKHLFEMEFRGLQTAKLAPTDTRPLAGRVVAISGAAGAIGAGIAEVCALAGAHIALTDIDIDRLIPIAERIDASSSPGSVVAIRMDVTDETSVVAGFDEIARTFGGIDVVVPNAGVAHVCSIEKMDVADFRRVMDINATGYMLFMREGIGLLKRQGLGGHLVLISSKNVAGPGKDFGAYSASKAAAHQLGRVAALELAGDGIRVNMVTPDAVFGDASTPSGLWETVGPQRAKSRGMSEAELADFYRERSLLKVPVLARHVGNAVVFFASGATPTTGAVLPVDGGLPDAFPR